MNEIQAEEKNKREREKSLKAGKKCARVILRMISYEHGFGAWSEPGDLKLFPKQSSILCQDACVFVFYFLINQLTDTQQRP